MTPQARPIDHLAPASRTGHQHTTEPQRAEEARNTSAKGTPRRGDWLRRIGSGCVVLALTMLGIGAGLWLGSPASAATPPLKVDMGDGVFTDTPAIPLLSIASLAPGGKISGSMTVRDDSDSTAGTGLSDSIALGILDGWTTGSTCPASAPPACAGSGDALKDALVFTLSVQQGATVLIDAQALTADQLIAGVTLATRVIAPTDLRVTLDAALPDRDPAADNLLQYGTFAFSFGLAVTPTADPDNGPDVDTPTDPGDTDAAAGPEGGSTSGAQPGADAGGGSISDADGSIDVLGASGEQAGGSTGSAGPFNPENPDILVLGQSQEALGYTGAPITIFLVSGLTVLATGLVLVAVGRRRRTNHDLCI